MNAFNLFPAAPTVAPEVAAANQVLSSGKQTAQLLLNTYQMSYNLVWNNKNASPDKVIAALGTSAVAVFAHAAATATFLTSLGAYRLPDRDSGWLDPREQCGRQHDRHQGGCSGCSGCRPLRLSRSGRSGCPGRSGCLVVKRVVRRPLTSTGTGEPQGSPVPFHQIQRI